MAASSKVSDIIEKVGILSVVELAELVKEFEEKSGVSASMPMAMAPAAAVAGGADQSAAGEDKAEFKVTLKEAGSEKIKVIKALRSVTSLALGDAKKAVDGVPYVVSESAPKEDAEKMKKTLEESGAKVELS